jgi:hypothetical protein
LYLERAEDLTRYREVFKRLQTIALSPKDTINAIVTIKAKFGEITNRAG